MCFYVCFSLYLPFPLLRAVMYEIYAQYTTQQLHEQLHPPLSWVSLPTTVMRTSIPTNCTPTPTICRETQEDTRPPTRSDVNIQRTPAVLLLFHPAAIISFFSSSPLALTLYIIAFHSPPTTCPFLLSASPLMKCSVNKHREEGSCKERYGQVERVREVEGWRDGENGCKW